MVARALGFAILAGLAVGVLWPDNGSVPADRRAPGSSAPPKNPAAETAAAKGFATFIDRAPDGHFYVEAQVNNQPVRFLVDTGATGIALTGADAARIGIAVDPSQFEVVGTGVSGPVMGKKVTLDSVQLDGKTASGLPAAVLGEGLNVSLLGQSFLSRYASVTIVENRMEMR